MSNLNDFLKLINEGKQETIKNSPGLTHLKQLKDEIHAENPFDKSPVSSGQVVESLGGFLSIVAEAKAADPKHQLLKEVKKRAQEDIAGLFGQLQEAKPVSVETVELIESKPAIEVVGEFLYENGQCTDPEMIAEVVVPEVKPAAEQVPMEVIDKYLKQNATFQQPNPDKVDPNMKAIQDKLKFMEQWLGKIAAHGPGSGEVNLRWLDDVKRETIADGRWLKYSEADKKFIFDEINPFQVVNNTTEITTTYYEVHEDDYYIGVNNTSAPVTIVLPTSTNSGRMLIIKDEDGDAETHPITVQGNVDNDPEGFIIQINNGGVQLIYRNGWRIV